MSSSYQVGRKTDLITLLELLEGVIEMFPKISSVLLEKVHVLDVAAKEIFVAAKNIVKDNDVIVSMTPRCKERVYGAIERNVPEKRVRISRLLKRSSDGQILRELGKRNEIALWHYYSVLKQLTLIAQETGEVSYNWLICYPNSIDNWAFCAFRRGSRWELNDFRLFNPYPWPAEISHVLSEDF